jgi:hypothetical protein
MIPALVSEKINRSFSAYAVDERLQRIWILTTHYVENDFSDYFAHLP